jgi:hypothetical protein
MGISRRLGKRIFQGVEDGVSPHSKYDSLSIARAPRENVGRVTQDRVSRVGAKHWILSVQSM